MRKLLSMLIGFGLAASFAIPARAATVPPQKDVSGLLIPQGLVADAGPSRPRVDTRLRQAQGQVSVVVQLKDAPLAIQNGAGFKQLSRANAARASSAQQQAYIAQLSQAQTAFTSQATALGAKEVARFSKALNAVAVKVDVAQIDKLAALPGVVSVRPIINYELALTETVPYIGAKAVQNLGYDGTGITVAVLDSGIDYMHRNFGGPGTIAAYQAAYGTSAADPKNKSRDGLFPTAKVVEGYDFVGEVWPNGPNGFANDDLAPDPDPIDAPGPEAGIDTNGGHGTQVADIIGGKSNDGLHVGVAPGVSLLALKVCSAVSSSCNGLALLQAVEYSLDPNSDGDISDAADVMNLSLGSSFGQREDDLSFALGNAVHSGVVVVASAGNSADRPYIVGSPSSQPEVISVAQTNVPSAKTFPLVVNSPASIAGVISNTNTVEWAPIGDGFTGDVVYVGRGCPAGSVDGTNPDDPYLTNPAGKVALILRGGCAVSLKVDRATKAGAVAALIQNNVSGDPPTFSYGGGDLPMVPTVIITLQDGNTIRAALTAGNTVNVSVSDAVFIPLVGSIVASSSRGPTMSYNSIKPDIGAPGASVSAVSGSGAGEQAFGGTSGAAPMVSGSAALVLDAHPDYSPRDVKAVLVNTANNNIQINPATQPGVLAPITRIGGGEVRVDKAVKTTTAAWSADDTPSLSFGYRSLSEDATFRRRVIVRNYSDQARTYSITPSFRYANDAASGAVTPSAPATINVPANGTRSFVVELAVSAAKLPTWPFGGSNIGTGSLLQTVEFDGYVNIADATDSINVPWQILPHKSAAVEAEPKRVKLSQGNTVQLNNTSLVLDGDVEVFSLTGVSPRIGKDVLPLPGANYAIIDLKAAGVRPVMIGGTPAAPVYGVQFGIASNYTRAHPLYPAGFDIYVDNNRDGDYEFVLYNSENGGFGATGQCIVNILNLDTGAISAFFFCDSDFNSANIIYTAPLSALGIAGLDAEFSFDIVAYDNYFTGNASDFIYYATSTLSAPRFYADTDFVTVPAGGSATLTIGSNDVPTEAAQTSGLLLLYRDARAGKQSEVIRVNP